MDLQLKLFDMPLEWRRVPVTLIIDMQPRFEASDDEDCQLGCINLIRQAIQARHCLIFAEYHGFGGTLPNLYEESGSYSDTHIVTKHTDDGSFYILRYLDQIKVIPESFIIGGINTNACVRRTARGINEAFKENKVELPLVKFVADACHGCGSLNADWEEILDMCSSKEYRNMEVEGEPVNKWEW
jgi:hypothetical protein